ncbi:inactive ubiquitin carboxyl-terminal hydrolase MINDY-4B-like [Antedon mediterranea]|uniref:inactive ubiquitin carboxyl-terminal hydrolase MINDY-4B-like n=1 Tax=Antedon mediterranea TaxID=105859 RepID=UPI003AF8F6A7
MTTLRDRIKRLNLKSLQKKSQEDSDDDEELAKMDPLERLARTLELTATVPKEEDEELSDDDGVYNPFTHPSKVDLQIGPKTVIPSMYKPVQINITPQPVALETAAKLRDCLFGNRMWSFSPEWKNDSFQFQAIDSAFPYGLWTTEDGTRNVIICVQAFIMKNLLFRDEPTKHVMGVKASQGQPSQADKLKPFEQQRCDALIKAISDMLWQAGEEKRAIVVLMTEHSNFGPSAGFRIDHFVEKLESYEFADFQTLLIFIRKHLESFQSTHGVLIFIYSILLSRSAKKLAEDLQSERLILPSDRCSTNMVKLLLTGKATPHLFNGSFEYDDLGNKLLVPEIGLFRRSDVGLLYLDRRDGRHQRQPSLEVGTMLKTPKYPVWVTYINGKCGLLFCLKRNLLREARSEHCFDLRYYTGQRSQTEEAKITVDNISKHGERKKGIYYSKGERLSLLEECISSRWPEGLIDWHGTLPFI